MELQVLNNQNGVHPTTVATVDNSRFIEANTSVISLNEIQNKHIMRIKS